MENSLAVVHPEIADEWSEKNLPLTPDTVTYGSNRQVWWKGAWCDIDLDEEIIDVNHGFRFYCAMIAALTLVMSMSMTAFAAGDPITVVNNLSDFIFGLIRAIGLILLGFGIVQVGLSLKSHDPSQRANGFLTLAGGIIITFAKEILTLVAD